MSFIEGQKGRSREFMRRREGGEILFPVARMQEVFLYQSVDDKDVLALAGRIEKGDITGIPSEIIVQDETGALYFDMRALGTIEKPRKGDTQELRTLAKLLSLCDRDLMFRGERSHHIEVFKTMRRERDKQTAGERRKYLEQEVDWTMQLGDAASRHAFETPELKSAYETIRQHVQVIADNLFSASGLEKFKPVVHITRDHRENAFVFGLNQGTALKEYIESTDVPVELPIFVNYGTLSYIKSDDELAGVLAHESAHLLQPDYLEPHQDSNRSKRLEYDADATGMRLADAAGYNPRGLLSVFESFSKQGDHSSLSVLFGGSHPETQSRIIELEKLFHRTDVPMAHGQKPFQEAPQEIKKAFKSILKHEDAKPKSGDQEYYDYVNGNKEIKELESYLKEKAPESVFLTNGFANNVCQIGSDLLINECADQELAHDVLGIRTILLDNLRTFLEFFHARQGDVLEDGSPQFTLSYNNPSYGVARDESILALPASTDWARSAEHAKSFVLSSQEREKETQKRENFLDDFSITPTGLRAHTLEDFLDPYNEDVMPLWDMVFQRKTDFSTMTQEKKEIYGREALFMRLNRLGVLHSLIKEMLRGSNSSLAINENFIHRKNRRRKKEKEKESGGSASRLIHAAGILRTHGRVAEDESEEYVFEGKKLREIFSISGYRIDFFYNLWGTYPEDHPPLVRNLSQTVETKTIAAYKELLKKDGAETPSDGVLRFVLHMLHRIGLEMRVDSQTTLSCSFIDSAIRVLEHHNLRNVWHSGGNADGENTVKSARDALIFLCAFVLTPVTEEDKVLQARYSKRIELDPTISDVGELIIMQEKGLEDIKCDFRFVQKEESGDYTFYKIGSFSRKIALRERVWKEYRDECQAYFAHGGQNAAEARMRIEPRAEDVEHASFMIKRLGLSRQELEASEALAFQQYVADAVAVARAYMKLYKSEAVDSITLVEQYKNRKVFFKPFIESVSSACVARFSSLSPESARDIIDTAVSHILLFFYQDRMVEDNEMNVLLHESQKELWSTDKIKQEGDSGAGLWHAYSPHNFALSLNDLERIGDISDVFFLRMVEHRAKDSSAAQELFEYVSLLNSKGKLIPRDLRAACMGHMAPFVSGERVSRQNMLSVHETITLWQLASHAYAHEWANLEQFKRVDEQLSHWEWFEDNPFGLERTYQKKMSNKRKLEILHRDIENIICEINKFCYRYNDNFDQGLGKVYRVDTTHVDRTIRFSWSLFLQDVWDDRVETFSSWQEEDRTKFEGLVAYLKKEITRIVDDPDTLSEVLFMQDGFFKEFLLEKKLAAMGITSLEEVERWLPHFSAQYHEATMRNQISSQIENARSGVRDDTKKALMEQALKELGVTDEERIVLRVDTVFENMITDDACRVRTKFSPDIDEEKRVRSVSKKIFPQVYIRYKELMSTERARMQGKGKHKENEVLVFSDHVIENEKSKLEIGSAYRLRLASQPLMDWHARALRDAGSLEETQALFERVDSAIPGAHPLKDVFVKNQLSQELWHIMREAVGDKRLSELGVSLRRHHIDLHDALEKFPLYVEVSFLKNYEVLELEGMENAVAELPADIQSRILGTIEKVLEERVSPDAKPVLRRMLFALEEKITWPQLRQDVRVSGAQTFDEYLARIMHFFPEPTFERDQVLESIGMDLAQTPEQIRSIWNLRYDEEVKWIKEDEAKSTKGQFEAFEKARSMIGFMNESDRAAYVLWMIGGHEPLSEELSKGKTAISLEERSEMLWKVSPIERRHLLYEIFLGEHGVLETNKKSTVVPDDTSEDRSVKDIPVDLFPTWIRKGDMIRYLADNMFDLVFGEGRIDDTLPVEHATNERGKKMLHIIFRELFLKQPTPARRAELMINVMEAMGSAKREGKKLNAGQLITLLLEQVGVVGVKAGQVLSEQPGLLPESIRREMAQLKDSTTPFSKRGVLAYLESSGWVSGKESAFESIGEVVGSASIKQVLEGETKDGKRVAIKAKRPSIDKNFEDDLQVLRGVIEVLQKEGFEVPPYLLNEIEKVARDELSFTHETDNQLAIQHAFEARNACVHIEAGGESSRVPLNVADIYFPPSASEEDIGLMIEQFVRGFSLKEVRSYQQALAEGDDVVIKKMQNKTERMYGEPSLIPIIEEQVRTLNIDKLQAEIGLELLEEITQDGVFHADLHSGNILFDLHPLEKHATLIDMGSVGYGQRDVMPAYLKEATHEGFDARAEFRDFLTAFFAPSMNYGVVADTIKNFAHLEWTADDVARIMGDEPGTEGKAKKIFYALLERGGAQMDSQFRYLLKSLATAAGHFDKLKEKISEEMASSETEPASNSLLKRIFERELINVSTLF